MINEHRRIMCQEGHGKIRYELGDTTLTMTEDGKFTIRAGDKDYSFSKEHSDDLWSLFVAHNEFMMESRAIGIHTVTPTDLEPETYEN